MDAAITRFSLGLEQFQPASARLPAHEKQLIENRSSPLLDGNESNEGEVERMPGTPFETGISSLHDSTRSGDCMACFKPLPGSDNPFRDDLER